MQDVGLVHGFEPLQNVSSDGLELLLIFDFTFSVVDFVFKPLGVFDEFKHTYNLLVVLRVFNQLNNIVG